jgi:autotransporter-associated beta strand protein
LNSFGFAPAFIFCSTSAISLIGNSGNNDFFNVVGSVDDVRIYNRALSQAEISRLAAGTQPQTSSGSVTLAGAVSLSGALSVNAGTLDVSSSNYALTASGGFVNNGGIFTPRSGTVTLNGAASSLQFGGSSLNALTLGRSTTLTQLDSGTISSTLTVGAGSTLSIPTYALTASSTITNLGTLTQTSGGKIVHSGAVSVSPSSLAVGGSVTVTVTDGDANTNASSAETVTVTADGETFTLTETAVASGIFTGTIPTAHGAQMPNNGVIEHDDSCSFRITPHYRDPEDASDDQSATATVTDANAACVTGASGGGGGGRRGTASSATSKKSSSSSRPVSSRSPVRSGSSSRFPAFSRSSSSRSSVRGHSSSSSRKTTTRFRKSVFKKMP